MGHVAVSIRDVGHTYSYFSAPPDHTPCGAKGGGAMPYSTIKDKPSLKTTRAPSSHKLLSRLFATGFHSGVAYSSMHSKFAVQRGDSFFLLLSYM